MTIDPTTGRIAWTPTDGQQSPDGVPYQFTVRVTDSRFAVDLGPAAVEVIDRPGEVKHPPQFVRAVSSGTVAAGEPLTLPFEFIDFDGDGVDLSFAVVAGSATGGSFNWTNGTARLGRPADPQRREPHDHPRRHPLRRHARTARARDRCHRPRCRAHGCPERRRPQRHQPPAVGVAQLPEHRLRPGQTLTAQVDATEPDAGDTLTYGFVTDGGAVVTAFTGGDLNGLEIDPQSGEITWTPANGQQTPAGGAPYAFTVRVSDGTHDVDLGPVAVKVADVPDPAQNRPRFVRATASGTVLLGDPIDIELDFFDFDAGATASLAYSVVEGGGSGTFDWTNGSAVSNDPASPDSATLAFTPAAAGATTLLVTLTDDTGRSSTHTVSLETIDPSAVQRPPVASLSARTATAANEAFVAQVEATDPNGDTLTYGLSFPDPARAPTGMSIDPATGRITWTPGTDDITPADGQPYLYTVTVTDGQTDPVEIGPVPLTVVARFTNAAPTITSDPTGLRAGADGLLVYEATAEDADGDPLRWSLESGPSTASIDPSTGRFVWRPQDVTQDRDQEARITVTDPYGASHTQVVILRSVAGNSAPRITSTAPQPGYGGETWRYLVRAEDAERDAITFSLAGDAAGLSITQTSGTTAVVEWVDPPAGATKEFQIVATDARGLAGRQTLRLTIGTQGGGGGGGGGSVDTPPAITSTPTFAVVEGGGYRYQVVADDPDGAITYGITGPGLARHRRGHRPRHRHRAEHPRHRRGRRDRLPERRDGEPEPTR